MIKNKLRSILKNRKISIVKLSKDTGLSRQSIYQFMNNKGLTYNLNTMNVICDYLNMNINDIIYYSEKALDFQIYSQHNSIDIIRSTFGDDSNSYISRLSGYLNIIKGNNDVDYKKITINFFKRKDQYFMSYSLGKMTNYEQSILSNNKNMVKIAKLLIKYILDYVDIIKVAKQQLDSNNLITDNISNKSLDEFLSMNKGKIYDFQIIPCFYRNRLTSGMADSDLIEYSDSSLVNIKAKITKLDNNKIDISNVKNKKQFGYLKHVNDSKLNVSGYVLLNIDK